VKRVDIGRIIHFRDKEDSLDSWKEKHQISWESSWSFFLERIDKKYAYNNMLANPKVKLPEWFLEVEREVFGESTWRTASAAICVCQELFKDEIAEEML
jgi:hypothetical protein